MSIPGRPDSGRCQLGLRPPFLVLVWWLWFCTVSHPFKWRVVFFTDFLKLKITIQIYPMFLRQIKNWMFGHSRQRIRIESWSIRNFQPWQLINFWCRVVRGLRLPAKCSTSSDWSHNDRWKMVHTYAEDFYRYVTYFVLVFVTCFLVLLSTFAVIVKYLCANLQQKCRIDV